MSKKLHKEHLLTIWVPDEIIGQLHYFALTQIAGVELTKITQGVLPGTELLYAATLKYWGEMEEFCSGYLAPEVVKENIDTITKITSQMNANTIPKMVEAMDGVLQKPKPKFDD